MTITTRAVVCRVMKRAGVRVRVSDMENGDEGL